MKNYAKIMGIQFPKNTLYRTVEILDEVIEQKKPELFHVITVNPEITMACQEDGALRSIVDEAGLITADGIGICNGISLERWKSLLNVLLGTIPC